MILEIAGFIVLIALIFCLIKVLGELLSQKGYDGAAQIVKSVEREILITGQEALEKATCSFNSYASDISPELIEKIFDEGFPSLLELLPSSNQQMPSVKEGLLIITDDKDHPFQITPLISHVAEKICLGKTTQTAKAVALFNWFQKNISYGDSKRGAVGYRTSSEVFLTREGVCGEMAILFIVMSRVVGLQANYLSVRKDCYGNNVNHACATVFINFNWINIDPAYFTYDIHHQETSRLTDKQAVPHLKAFRRV